MDGQQVDQSAYIDSAVRAVQNKKQVPEIDFTLHTMEDGTQVSTQERVCKGMSATLTQRRDSGQYASSDPSGKVRLDFVEQLKLTFMLDRRSGACLQHADRGAACLTTRPVEA